MRFGRRPPPPRCGGHGTAPRSQRARSARGSDRAPRPAVPPSRPSPGLLHHDAALEDGLLLVEAKELGDLAAQLRRGEGGVGRDRHEVRLVDAVRVHGQPRLAQCAASSPRRRLAPCPSACALLPAAAPRHRRHRCRRRRAPDCAETSEVHVPASGAGLVRVRQALCPPHRARSESHHPPPALAPAAAATPVPPGCLPMARFPSACTLRRRWRRRLAQALGAHHQRPPPPCRPPVHRHPMASCLPPLRLVFFRRSFSLSASFFA